MSYTSYRSGYGGGGESSSGRPRASFDDDHRYAGASGSYHRGTGFRDNAVDRDGETSSAAAFGGRGVGRGRGRGRGGFVSRGAMGGPYESGRYGTARGYNVDPTADDDRQRYPAYGRGTDVSPRKSQLEGSRTDPEDAAKGRPKEPEIDWADVNRRARDNGWVVPSDIVEEFKRQGHFDTLRRSLLSTFQSTPTGKSALLDSISTLLLSWVDSHPHEANRIGMMGDVRLQHAELMKVLDSDEKMSVGTGQVKVEGAKEQEKSGPQILASFLEQLQDCSDARNPSDRPAATVAGQAAAADNAGLDRILSPTGTVGLEVGNRLQSLLQDEKRSKKVAPPDQDAHDAQSTQKESSKSAQGTPMQKTGSVKPNDKEGGHEQHSDEEMDMDVEESRTGGGNEESRGKVDKEEAPRVKEEPSQGGS